LDFWFENKPSGNPDLQVPLVGWRLGDELVYLAEGADHDTSSLIQWAQQMSECNLAWVDIISPIF
jgi:hypothetical protein